jgi:uncharacterized membrane protein
MFLAADRSTTPGEKQCTEAPAPRDGRRRSRGVGRESVCAWAHQPRTEGSGGLRGGRGINVQKTINIQAPVERVYEIWSHPENFPHFMSRVRQVTDLGDGRYHWTVVGPAGIPCSWTGAITKQAPNALLEFTSEPGSVVEQHGVVRFEPKNGGTRVDVKMSYRPPAGAAGHVVAKLFGADPRSEMIADLVRMKSFIETGRPPHDAADARPEAAPRLCADGAHSATLEDLAQEDPGRGRPHALELLEPASETRPALRLAE